ncbi:unnamed protein product [Calicophoron daubneyi]|uniref:Fe2OG dioxygenase domain-containing protein n=1 Tax=Calicophoron daubneyi TaxID=300641 RepID=A0AAV2TW43_CALDB
MERNKSCGCKGIRHCALCSDVSLTLQDSIDYWDFDFCAKCGKAHSAQSHSCGTENDELGFPFYGVRLYPEFISSQEEQQLLERIDQNPWSLSQSGRRKQDYGPKVNFKRERVSVGRFTGLPAYSRFIVQRINQAISTGSDEEPEFSPVELCNLEYYPARGACIVPHSDDAWLWGDRLITLNICSPTVLTFTLPSGGSSELMSHLENSCKSADLFQTNRILAVRVPLARRSLVIVDGPARYTWLHEIRRSDICDRRIAITFRELSRTFLPPLHSDAQTTETQSIGRTLLNIAQTYEGFVCSV